MRRPRLQAKPRAQATQPPRRPRSRYPRLRRDSRAAIAAPRRNLSRFGGFCIRFPPGQAEEMDMRLTTLVMIAAAGANTGAAERSVMVCTASGADFQVAHSAQIVASKIFAGIGVGKIGRASCRERVWGVGGD